MNGMITCAEHFSVQDCLEKIKAYRVQGTVEAVTRKAPQVYPAMGEQQLRVALMDFGVKENMIRCLQNRGCEVTVFPAHTPAETVLSGGWVRSLLGHGGSMAFCLPEKHCPAELSAQLYGYMEQARNTHQYPLLLVDYCRDILLVDEVISDSPRYLEFLPDGQAVTYADGRKQPLPDVLSGLSLSAFLRSRFRRT